MHDHRQLQKLQLFVVVLYCVFIRQGILPEVK